MARRAVTVFYAWQSDRATKVNRNFIRIALDDAATRLSGDRTLDVEVMIDADTEGVVGTPPVTETILRKIGEADIFVPDLTYVAETTEGKLIPNPNVMAEYGYALRALTFEGMMPVMNTHFGPPEKLPFDLGHVRHPIQYDVAPDMPDDKRRAARSKLSVTFEAILRPMIQNALGKSRIGTPFQPTLPVRPPAFFFKATDVLANFGDPGEQELRFKRDRAIYLRLYPKYADQPHIGLTRAIAAARRVMPLHQVIASPSTRNEWGAISVEPHGEGITSFTQVFESGELWGMSEEPFRNGPKPVLAAIPVEKAYVAALGNYRTLYEDELRLRPPFKVEFGAVGLKDRYLGIPSQTLSNGEYAGPFDRDSLSVSADLGGFEWSEWQAALRDFLVRLYDRVARDRATVLTDVVVAAHRLPPR